MAMQRIPGSEFSIPADLIFLAMGFLGPKVEGLLEEIGVEFSVRGTDGPISTENLKNMLKNSQPIFNIYADINRSHQKCRRLIVITAFEHSG